ncbi:MAG TPA: AmmeMemoRadiSam system protein B [Candidatus Kapabacteria bacterium]|nr:AmmeMemoRadiSam system protein B [Candidatus Kapabacteria bacterium]
MSLVFAGMTPHPPLLIPTIGKDKVNSIKDTKAALERLEQDLYVAKPNVIVIISPHSGLFPDAFTINAHTSFSSAFQEFGDLVTKYTWKGCPDLAAQISHRAKKENIPLQLVSEESLDHGATVPLAYLTSHLKDVQILPIGYSGLSRDMHIQFGHLLKEMCMESSRRIAVIASGDLSHKLPIGLTAPDGAFDLRLKAALETNSHDDILNFSESEVADADQCGYYSLLILLGMLGDRPFHFETYSYEGPFGVGYLVGNFHI